MFTLVRFPRVGVVKAELESNLELVIGFAVLAETNFGIKNKLEIEMHHCSKYHSQHILGFKKVKKMVMTKTDLRSSKYILDK